VQPDVQPDGSDRNHGLILVRLQLTYRARAGYSIDIYHLEEAASSEKRERFGDRCRSRLLVVAARRR